MSIENEFYSGASTRTQLTLLAIEYGNLSIPENLVMTSAYAQTYPARTDSRVKGKKTEQCRERNPWYGRCVSFWRKTNHLKGNQPVKFLIQVSCVWVTTKFSVINFWGLVTFLVTDSRNNLVPPPPPPPPPPALVSNILCSCTAVTKWKTTAVPFLSSVFQNWLVLFSFSLRNGSQRGSSMLRFCWFAIVHVSSYGGLQKKSFDISNYWLLVRVLPLSLQNEIQLQWRCLCC